MESIEEGVDLAFERRGFEEDFGNFGEIEKYTAIGIECRSNVSVSFIKGIRGSSSVYRNLALNLTNRIENQFAGENILIRIRRLQSNKKDS
jgi:hypothetical protein